MSEFNDNEVSAFHSVDECSEAALIRVAPCTATGNSAVHHWDGQVLSQILGPACC